MHRPRFGSVLAAVAVATAGVIPFFAAPAFAANACGAPGGTFPATPGAQSSWKIACTTNAGAKVDNLAFADAPDGYWHRGTARTATVVPVNNSQSINYAAGQITAADIGRPISGGCLKGGAFIETAGPTAGTVSTKQPATGCASVAAKVEYTTSRVIQNASCTTGGVLTTPAGAQSGLFSATDVNKSVSGGPFGAGAKITAVANANQVTVAPAPSAPCTAGTETLTIGASTYSGANPVWNNDPMGVTMTNSAANGQAFSYAVVAGKATFTQTAAAVAMGQNFNAAYAKLKVVATGTNTVTTAVTSATATALTTSAATCPTGISATAGSLTIGEPNADAPKNGSPMATFGASLNLNPALVPTYDDCNKNTYESIEIIGAWNNPGTYTSAVGSPVLVSTGQVVFPTSVVSFAAYVRPQASGNALQAGSHYEYVFPSLPTTLAVCLNAGSPANPSALTFGVNATALATAPFLATGTGGNPADPAIRALGPQTGAQTGHYALKSGTATVATGALPTCMIAAATATPGFGCGAG